MAEPRVARVCTRCGRKIEGQWVIGSTCRNVEACKRREAKAAQRFYNACTEQEKALMRSGCSSEDIEYQRAKAALQALAAEMEATHGR